MEASEVEVENATNADEVRLWAVRALDEMMQSKGTSGQPARVRVKVTVDVSQSPAYWIFSPLTFTYGVIIGAPWWAALGHVNVTARLTMEAGGKLFEGVGWDEQGMRAGNSPDECYRAAVHNAVQNALEHASETVRSPVAEAR